MALTQGGTTGRSAGVYLRASGSYFPTRVFKNLQITIPTSFIPSTVVKPIPQRGVGEGQSGPMIPGTYNLGENY